MIFAKIDFINLLPFYVFIKKNIKSTQTKQIIQYKKSYPSKINKKFHKKQIDAAFISSIVSKNSKCLDIGIVAKKEVLSVLAIKGQKGKDYQSNTSNKLADILGIEDRVLIGDKALYHYYNFDTTETIDLAKQWYDKYNLPFVFARLCTNKHHKKLRQLSHKFLSTKVKIPQYILKQYATKTNISQKQILEYLTKISYKIGTKEKKSLKLFFKLSKI